MKEKRLIKKVEKKIEENIYNVPNFLTLLRVIITFMVIYLVFSGASIITIVVLFVIGMLTDAADGQIARMYKLTTEFGRKFDMLADRFLMIGTIIAILIHFALSGLLNDKIMMLIIMIMTREIIALPIGIMAFFSGKIFPKAKPIGKMTTVLQAIAFPAVVLSVYYSGFELLANYMALITAVSGVFSAVQFVTDVMFSEEHKK